MVILYLGLLCTALAGQKINYKYFEKQDKDKDGKITVEQFHAGCVVAIKKSVLHI